jgi:choline monooxygenase
VLAFADVVMDEDRRMVEAVQRNLAAGTYEHGLLSPRHENGLLQFQDLVRAADAAFTDLRLA